MAKKKAEDSARVRAIIAFIEQLIIPSGEGEGQPFKLREFQKQFIRDVYGPHKRNGQRIVRRAVLSIARKNGKSVFIAALALVHLVGPESVRNGEIYSAATEREQAALVFKYAAQIVRADAELEQYIKIVDSTKSMVCFGNGSVYRAISAEAGSKYGLNPTVVIYDELAQARNRDLFDALDTSMAARLEPLMIIISTQSNDPQHILSQIIDDGMSGTDKTTVCHLYAVPDDAEDVFDNEELWYQANPALGDFRSLDEMRTAAARAKRMPSFESAFRNLYLNQRIDAQSPLIPRAEWVACKAAYNIEYGTRLFMGLDLSGTTDLSALVGVTDETVGRMMAHFWKPQDTLKEHENNDRVPYKTWMGQGWLDVTPGRSIRYEFLAEKIAQLHHHYKIIGIAFDRWKIEDMLKAMANIGLDCYIEGKDEPRAGALRMVLWGQGWKDMAPAIDSLERAVLDRLLIHDGNPVMTWNISNAMAISDPAGNRKFDKSKSRFRIDGAVALAMAQGLKSRDMAKGPVRSAYEGMSQEQISGRMSIC